MRSNNKLDDIIFTYDCETWSSFKTFDIKVGILKNKKSLLEKRRNVQLNDGQQSVSFL